MTSCAKSRRTEGSSRSPSAGEATDWIPVQRCYDDGCADLVAVDQPRATARRIFVSAHPWSSSVMPRACGHRCWRARCNSACCPTSTDLQRHAARTELRLPRPVGRPVGRQRSAGPAVVSAGDQRPSRAAGRGAPGQDGAASALRQCRGGPGRSGGTSWPGVRPELSDAVAAVTESLLATGDLAGTGHLDRRGRSAGAAVACTTGCPADRSAVIALTRSGISRRRDAPGDRCGSRSGPSSSGWRAGSNRLAPQGSCPPP